MQYFINSAGDVYAGDRQIRLIQGDGTVIYDSLAPDRPDNTTWDKANQLWASVQVPLSARLTGAFTSLIQKHLGQPYLTNAVEAQIGGVVPAVLLIADNPLLVNFAKAPVQALSLPAEMQADQADILAMFP